MLSFLKNHHSMSRTSANLLLLLAAFIWGSAFVAQSIGMKTLPPLAFTGIRFLFGALLIVPFANREIKTLFTKGQESVHFLKSLLLLGLILAGGATLQQAGLVTTSVTNAGFLTALYVPLVPIFSFFLFKESPPTMVWPISFLCLLGSWLLVGDLSSLSFSFGDTMVLLGTVFWTLHILFLSRVLKLRQSPFLIASGQFFVCGVFSLTLSFIFESFSLSDIWQGILPLLYAGFFSVALAYTLQVLAQAHTQAFDAAIIFSSETLFAAFFGYALLGDRLNAWQMTGCALIFGGMIAIQLLPLLAKPKLSFECHESH